MAWAEERAVLKSAASSPAAGANSSTSSSKAAQAAVAAELEQLRTDNAALRQQLAASAAQSKSADITMQQLQSEVSFTLLHFLQRLAVIIKLMT
jgi:hypothetical protein